MQAYRVLFKGKRSTGVAAKQGNCAGRPQSGDTMAATLRGQRLQPGLAFAKSH
jgi:hypothetical protein